MLQQSVASQNAGKLAYEAHREHLPGRPRTLPEKDVRHEHRQRSGDEPLIAPEAQPRNDDERSHGLHGRHGGEDQTTGDSQRSHDDNRHDVARPAALGLETCASIVATIQQEIAKGNLTAEQQKSLIDQSMELVRIMREIEADGKRFRKHVIYAASIVFGFMVAALVSTLGNRADFPLPSLGKTTNRA